MIPSQRVLLFGELLARYTTPLHQRFVQAATWDITFTGGEANAALVLADLGHQPALLSAVPTHEVGQACINYMRRFGIDTHHVQRRAGRLGLLYVEQGAAQRASKVIYDRQHSVFAQLTCGDIDWPQVLKGMQWLHFTGTAPALSPQLVELTRLGCETAHTLGIPVSCDVSYRSALWSVPAARHVMMQLVPMIDVLIVNEEHARLLLDAPFSGDSQDDPFCADRYRTAMEFLADKHALSHVAFTIRAGDTSNHTSISAAVWHDQTCHMARRYDIDVVDRIGAGDAFSGALVAGILEDQPWPQCVEFATAASCLKHSVPGDFAHIARDEIEALVAGHSAGRVAR